MIWKKEVTFLFEAKDAGQAVLFSIETREWWWKTSTKMTHDFTRDLANRSGHPRRGMGSSSETDKDNHFKNLNVSKKMLSLAIVCLYYKYVVVL